MLIEIVRRLRFVDSTGNDIRILFDTAGLLEQHTLRGVRQLTPESADMLAGVVEVDSTEPTLLLIAEAYEADEGRFQLHIRFERECDHKVIRLKKLGGWMRTGQVTCECCVFDFSIQYHELADGFSECHHRKPIPKLEKGDKTRLEALAILCINYQWVLHLNEGMTVDILYGHLKSGH